MSYVGSAPSPSQVQFSTLDAQAFNGDGSTTAFTLNRAVSIAASIEVTVNNVQQSPYDGSYTVNGTTTLTFSEAPSSGTDNIYVRFLDYPLASITPGNDTVGIDQLSATGTPSSSTFLRGDNSWQAVSVTPTAVSSQANSATDYFALPAGTTAQRPGSPAAGYTRFNTTIGQIESYDGSAWLLSSTGPTYSIDYLVVAGGGSGGQTSSNSSGTSGGGGAGGYIASSGTAVGSETYAITIGAGGAGVTGTGGTNAGGNNGENTTLIGSGISVTALGGGKGSHYNVAAGGNGGSGGGGAVNASPGSGTFGQGYAGGANGGTNGWQAGGGGGASAAGAAGVVGFSGVGGAGLNWQSLGTYYAGGGGGGGGADGLPGGGGLGGGSAGGSNLGNSSNATANTGGGSGASGCGNGGTVSSGNGGSGVVIIRYSGSQRGSGGTVTSSGGYTYHTFTTSGTYTA